MLGESCIFTQRKMRFSQADLEKMRMIFLRFGKPPLDVVNAGSRTAIPHFQPCPPSLGAKGHPSRLGIDQAWHYNYSYNMTMKTKVRKIGNSMGIVLPKEALQTLKVKEGATLYLTAAPECSLRVTPEKDGFAEKARIAEDLMQRYRNALRELAK